MQERIQKIVILLGARSPIDLVYAAEIDAWSQDKDIETRVSVDHGTSGWTRNVGVVTKIIE